MNTASMREEVKEVVFSAFQAIEAEAPPERTYLPSREALPWLIQGIARMAQLRLSHIFDKWAEASEAFEEDTANIVCEDEILETSGLKNELLAYWRSLELAHDEIAVTEHRARMLSRQVPQISADLERAFAEAIMEASKCIAEEDDPPIRPTRQSSG